MLRAIQRSVVRTSATAAPQRLFSRMPIAIRPCAFQVPDKLRAMAPAVWVQRSHDVSLQGFGSDGAGSGFDLHCLAPPISFKTAFKKVSNIDITMEQARGPMGIAKEEHIKQLFAKVLGRAPTLSEVKLIHEEFLAQQLGGVLQKYADPVPHLMTLFKDLDSLGIKFGFHSAYSRAEVAIVKNAINLRRAEHGLPAIEHFISNDDVTHNRPWPGMMQQLCDKLGVMHAHEAAGLDDTVKGVEALVNGGYWAIGAAYGNLMNINSLEEGLAMTETGKNERLYEAAQKLAEKGAHYVITDLRQVKEIMQHINLRMARGERPTAQPVLLQEPALEIARRLR